jgi:uncharacterized OB-fold protein
VSRTGAAELRDAWWAAAGEGRLLVQRCEACGHHQHHPRPFCLACGSGDVGFVEASGRGVLHSFTVVHRSPRPDLEAPYIVALVDLAEGPRLLTWMVDVDPDALRCDAEVQVAFRAGLPVFVPSA